MRVPWLRTRDAAAPRRRLRSRPRCRAASRCRRRGGGRSPGRREKVDDVLVGLAPGRLIGGRPHRAAAHVAQVDELPVRVACRVAAPARHRQAAPDAGAAAGVGDRGDVVAVREELRVRKRGVRRAVAADRHRRRRRGGAHLVERPRLDRRDVARHALLQQQLGRLDPRLGVKALDHPIAEQRVGQRHERHALVMRHVGAARRAAGVPRGRGWSAVGLRLGAAVACSRSRRRTRTRPRGRRRPAGAGSPRLAAGSIITASAVAYGATTSSSPRPRFSPSPGTPNALY